MFRSLCLSGLAVVLALPAAAQSAETFAIGSDAFRAGALVEFDAESVDDLFAAGETVRTIAPVAGSAHLAGRDVEAAGDVGGDLYAAGMNVTVTGRVAGDATVAGYDLRLGEVGGDLRATGSTIRVDGPVGGYALLAGEDVRLDGAVAGDVRIAARDIVFGDGARIDGTLTLFEDEPGDQVVPDSVVPPDRVVRREAAEFEEAVDEIRPVRFGALVVRFLLGILMVTALAALIAAVLPEKLARLRLTLLGHPARTLWIGILTQAAVVGGAVLSALTLIGLLAVPGFFLVAGVLGFVGYVIGVYALGVAAVGGLGRGIPASFGDRAIAAAAGAVVAAVVALIPFLGWLFVLALSLAGTGAIAVAWANPRFFGGET